MSDILKGRIIFLHFYFLIEKWQKNKVCHNVIVFPQDCIPVRVQIAVIFNESQKLNQNKYFLECCLIGRCNQIKSLPPLYEVKG